MPKRQTRKRTVNPYDEENTDASAPTAPKAAASSPRKPRRTRIPLHQAGGRRNLHVPEFVQRHFHDLGYHLCWVNDDRGNKQKHFQAGYEDIDRKELPDGYEELGDPDVGSGDSGLDGRISQVVGKNHLGNAPLRAYLMKQPLEYHAEDVALSQEKPDKIDEAIYSGASTNSDGEQRSVDNVYGRVEYR